MKLRLQLGIAVITAYSILKQVSSQTYITDCNNPVLLNHITQGHTYCEHACRPNPPGPNNVCSPAGKCLCGVDCYDAGMPMPPMPADINNEYCPLTGPFETPTSEADCAASCAGACPGGFGGHLCKENERPNAPRTRYRICTCLCPAQVCVPPTPPPVIPIILPTTAPIALPDQVTPMTSVVIFPLAVSFTKLGLLTKKIALIIKKLYVLCWLLLKIYIIKAILIFCIQEMTSYFLGINYDFAIIYVYNILRFMFRYFLRI